LPPGERRGPTGGAGSFNPITKKVERRDTLFEKVGDDVCGVAAYTSCLTIRSTRAVAR
jgi:hypothetical protein